MHPLSLPRLAATLPNLTLFSQYPMRVVPVYLQEAIRVCSAGFAFPLASFCVKPILLLDLYRRSFGIVVHDLWYATDGDSTHGPMFSTGDRRYFFEYITPSVQMHYAETA